MGDKFFLGTCSNCRQRAEVHEGSDGMAYCEDCLVMLGKDKETADKLNNTTSDRISVRQEVVLPKTVTPSKRSELIDYIVTRADNNWIDRFLQSAKDNYSWVILIEQEQNERVLLRLATELGYKKLTSEGLLRIKPTSINQIDNNGKAEESRPDKGIGKRTQGSFNRTRTKKESKPVSL